ncbi:hypothetical protein AB0M43_07140 [Longispora sp. NPDC051575]|uniref:hypothetical protein n=1 Tax=Longispora sp. NPDC051575 TaxID=3154943 RepID=UPI003438D936
MRQQIIDRELAHVLRTGPFSAALHLAIEASGMRVEEIQNRLAALGIMVSQSALAYWRRGRRRPERPDSLRAVHALEGILGLPADSLTAQLGPRRPRGRWLDHAAGTMALSDGWADSENLPPLLAAIEAPRHSALCSFSHDLYRLGPDRAAISLTTRHVLRATRDNISRHVITIKHDEGDRSNIPTAHALRNCRIGRTRADADGLYVVTELIFDRVLNTGETAIVEYELRFGPGVVTDHYTRMVPVPLREYILEVQFDPAAIPARCLTFSRRKEPAPDQGVREVWVGNTHAAHLVDNDIMPGMLGMRWEWT